MSICICAPAGIRVGKCNRTKPGKPRARKRQTERHRNCEPQTRHDGNLLSDLKGVGIQEFNESGSDGEIESVCLFRSGFGLPNL